MNRSSMTPDFVIVGSDLHALLIAKGLRAIGAQTVLLESRDQSALGNRSPLVNGVRLPASLRYAPDLPESRSALDWAESLLHFDRTYSPLELRPVTRSSGGDSREFVGFGDKAPLSREELSFYMASRQLLLGPSFESLVEELTCSSDLNIKLRHEVTSLAVKDGQVISVEVNGETRWVAGHYIFTGSPYTLLPLLPPKALEPKTRSRLAKSSSWTTVQLAFAHKTTVEPHDFGIHFLLQPGPNHEPGVGRWLSPEPDGSQLSTWLTLVPPERSEDLEFIGSSVRSLKRQIKKVHDSALEGLKAEKLTVLVDHCGGSDIRLKGFGWPEISNLSLASHLLSDLRGPLAHLDVARQALQTLDKSHRPVAQPDQSC